jgi:hypothetical protein
VLLIGGELLRWIPFLPLQLVGIGLSFAGVHSIFRGRASFDARHRIAATVALVTVLLLVLAFGSLLIATLLGASELIEFFLIMLPPLSLLVAVPLLLVAFFLADRPGQMLLLVAVLAAMLLSLSLSLEGARAFTITHPAQVVGLLAALLLSAAYGVAHSDAGRRRQPAPPVSPIAQPPNTRAP